MPILQVFCYGMTQQLPSSVCRYDGSQFFYDLKGLSYGLEVHTDYLRELLVFGLAPSMPHCSLQFNDSPKLRVSFHRLLRCLSWQNRQCS